MGISASIGLPSISSDSGCGPRADEAHPAAEHVPDLRQLVEAGLAQEAADLGDAVVVAGRLAAAADVGALGPHGAELGDDDDRAAGAEARLAEEDRAGESSRTANAIIAISGAMARSSSKRPEAVHHRLELPRQPCGSSRRPAAFDAIVPGSPPRRSRPRVRSPNNVPYHPHPHSTTYNAPGQDRQPAGLRTPRESWIPVHGPGRRPSTGQIIGRVTPLTARH